MSADNFGCHSLEGIRSSASSQISLDFGCQPVSPKHLHACEWCGLMALSFQDLTAKSLTCPKPRATSSG